MRNLEVGPLPDSSFIVGNRPAARPIPPTTATKEGKAKASKRKAGFDGGMKKARVPKKLVAANK